MHPGIIPYQSVEFLGTEHSSSVRHGIYKAIYGFRLARKESDEHWCSDEGHSYAGGVAAIWFEFERDVSLAKIGFSSRVKYNYDSAPRAFDVVGRVQKDDDWQILATMANVNFTQFGQAKAWLIPASRRREKFRQLGLRIKSAVAPQKTYACLHNILMWEERA